LAKFHAVVFAVTVIYYSDNKTCYYQWNLYL